MCNGDFFRPKLHYFQHAVSWLVEHGINLHSLTGERKHRSLKPYLRHCQVDMHKESHVARRVIARYLVDVMTPETFQETFPIGVLHSVRPDSKLKAMLLQSIPFCVDLAPCQSLQTPIGMVICNDLIEVSGGDAQVPMLGEVVGTFAAKIAGTPTLEPHLLLHQWVPTGAEETLGATGKHVCVHASNACGRFIAIDVGGGCHRIRRLNFQGAVC